MVGLFQPPKLPGSDRIWQRLISRAWICQAIFRSTPRTGRNNRRGFSSWRESWLVSKWPHHFDLSFSWVSLEFFFSLSFSSLVQVSFWTFKSSGDAAPDGWWSRKLTISSFSTTLSQAHIPKKISKGHVCLLELHHWNPVEASRGRVCNWSIVGVAI